MSGDDIDLYFVISKYSKFISVPFTIDESLIGINVNDRNMKILEMIFVNIFNYINDHHHEVTFDTNYCLKILETLSKNGDMLMESNDLILEKHIEFLSRQFFKNESLFAFYFTNLKSINFHPYQYGFIQLNKDSIILFNEATIPLYYWLWYADSINADETKVLKYSCIINKYKHFQINIIKNQIVTNLEDDYVDLIDEFFRWIISKFDANIS